MYVCVHTHTHKKKIKQVNRPSTLLSINYSNYTIIFFPISFGRFIHQSIKKKLAAKNLFKVSKTSFLFGWH